MWNKLPKLLEWTKTSNTQWYSEHNNHWFVIAKRGNRFILAVTNKQGEDITIQTAHESLENAKLAANILTVKTE